MIDYKALEKAAANSDKIPKFYVQMGDEYKSLLTEYGLILEKDGFSVNAPDVEGKQEYPPGYDIVLDFTQAVDSKVHFKQRKVSMRFMCFRPKSQWEDLRSQMETDLQGQWLTFYRSDAPETKYEGQFTVEMTPKEQYASVEIAAVCAP